jgi:hypothetical protein
LPPDWKPTTRVGVPKAIKPGDPFEVRTIISHPMETGLRLNARNQYEPLRIIETFTCLMNGEVAFSVELVPAIATTPYLAFSLVTAEPAQLDCEWLDTTGAIYRDQAAVALA